MKFGHKILIIVLILFVFTLDVTTITIMKKNWNLNLDREIERSLSEQSLIANNIFENINTIRSRGISVNENVYYNIASSYGNYYWEQGILLQLWDENSIVYAFEKETNIEFPAKTIDNVKFSDINYTQISKKLPAPHNNLTLVYKRNINSLYEMQSNLNNFFLTSNIIAAFCLIILLFIIIKNLTKPLLLLSETTKQIANGNYKEHIQIKSNDEFGQLADSFNKMTKSIEEHTTKLLQMAEEKQRLVDNLAHELRTPLTSMQGFADYLLNANISEEEKITAIFYIKDETKRLSQLSNKLIKISSLNNQKCEKKEISSKNLCECVLKSLEPQLKHKNITLKVNISAYKVFGDFDLLTSFIINCVENSIHSSSENTCINLSIYEYESLTSIEIQDYGCGMTSENTEKIFEAFYMVDKSRSKEHCGVGLGLAFCKQIAQVHNAKLNLYSKIGEGTKIILQLHNNFYETL